MLTFLAQYPHIFFKILLIMVAGVSILKYCRKDFLDRISWSVLFSITVGLQLFYATLLAIVQYFVWKGNAFTNILLISPLPAEVPLGWLESFRPLLDGSHGYYVFYAYTHFFLGFLVTLLVTSLCILFLSVWKKYQPTHFKKGDVFAVGTALILVEWPTVIILIPTALVVMLLVTIYTTFSKRSSIDLPIIFLLTSLTMLLIGEELLHIANLYTLFAV